MSELSQLDFCTQSMRTLIDSANQQEASTRAFDRYVGILSDELWQSEALQKTDKQALVEFSQTYIAIVPELTDKLLANAKLADLQDEVLPAVATVIEFFERAPIKAKSKTYQLLAQAFFANRLYEDINKQSRSLLKLDLIPIDLSFANVLIYQILGENFAAQLDTIVAQIANNLIDIQRSQLKTVSEKQKTVWHRQWAEAKLPNLVMPQALSS